MNRKLRFNDPKTKVWVASDWHIHHSRDFIWKPRGFTSVEESNRWILDDVNAMVGQNDVLLYLGDWMLNAPNDHAFEDFVKRIICQNVYAVWGNHEGPSWAYYQSGLQEKFGKDFTAEVYPFKVGNITFLGNYAEIEVYRQTVTLTHYPFRIWNKSHHSTRNLCGHSHGSFSETLPSANCGKVLDCGVDVTKAYWNHAVFSWEIIERIMKTKETPTVDHHDTKTT